MTASIPRSPPPVGGLSLALGSAGLYGFNIVYARIAALAGVTGPMVVLYRVVMMLALVAAAAALMRRSLAVAPGERVAILIFGATTAVLGLCYVSSVAFVPVTVAAVIFYTYPALIVLASPAVDKTRLTLPLLGVVAAALTGVVLVVGPAFDHLDWRGLALAFAAAVACAAQFFTAARCPRTDTAAQIFWSHLFVLPTAVLVSVATGSWAPPTVLAAAPAAVGLTIGGYLAGFLFQVMALRRISAPAAGIVYCFEPVIAAVTSVAVLSESLNRMQVAGGALVLAAIVTNIILERDRQVPLVPTD